MPLENSQPSPLALALNASDHFASPSNSPLEPKSPENWDPKILTVISEVTSRYQIKRKIGSGASAQVYLAIDTRFNRTVALKRFSEETLSSSAAESDYLSEVAAVSQVSHPNILRAHDLDDDEDGPFIIFEYIDGLNLEDRLKKGPLNPNQVRYFLVQALEALIAMHHKGISHLDLKPANFMETSENGIPHYTLIDFGRACDSKREEERRQHKGKQSLRGSLHYMAPEQFTNGKQDARTDLYSLGALAYELLTGQKAFDGDNAIQVMSAHLTSRIMSIDTLHPNLPDGLAPWIMSLLACAPDARPQTAHEALRSLLSLSTLNLTPIELSEPFPILDRTVA